MEILNTWKAVHIRNCVCVQGRGEERGWGKGVGKEAGGFYLSIILTTWTFAIWDIEVALLNFSVDPIASWLLLLLPKANTSHDSEMKLPSSPAPLATPRLKNEVQWVDTWQSCREEERERDIEEVRGGRRQSKERVVEGVRGEREGRRSGNYLSTKEEKELQQLNVAIFRELLWSKHSFLV